MRILSVFFFGVTTMGAHHAVASVTGVMTFCAISLAPISVCRGMRLEWNVGC